MEGFLSTSLIQLQGQLTAKTTATANWLRKRDVNIYREYRRRNQKGVLRGEGVSLHTDGREDQGGSKQ